MLTSAELRKLVRAHNKLSKIVIPKGSSRDDIIKLIEKAGYRVDHEKKAIKPKVQRGKQITLSQAEELTKPKPKTELQKQKEQEKKAEKEAMKKKEEREIRKKAVGEEKERQKKSMLKGKSDNNIKGDSKKEMVDTKFIKKQKALQVQKQKETRRALLKAKPPVDKTTRRGKSVKKGLVILTPKEYAPKDKPQRKKYNDMQDFNVDMRRYYEDYNENMTKILDEVNKLFNKKFSKEERIKFRQDNPNLSKIIKQIELNKKNIEKYDKASFKN